MKKVIFYSWQSDLPNSTNRGFIGDVLERAAKAIHADDSVEVSPQVDRDTSGVAGSPDIARTIFDKIASADVFVADVSIVTDVDAPRAMPNPNVLLELGYAIRAIGWERIVLIMNTAFGPVDRLPFDLRGRRVTTYDLPKSSGDKPVIRRRLEPMVDLILRDIFAQQAASVVPVPPAPSRNQIAIEAIATQKPDRVATVRRAVKHFDEQLAAVAPAIAGPSPSYQVFNAGLDAAASAIAEFGEVAQQAAASDDRSVCFELYRSLEAIVDRYSFRGSGQFYNHDFDYWRFAGYQRLVMFVAALIEHDRWETLGAVLDRDLVLENTGRGPDERDFTGVFGGLHLASYTGAPQHRLSLRADILKERHSAAPLMPIVSFRAFTEADYFLFLRANLPPLSKPDFVRWVPESAVFLGDCPRYLREAKSLAFARRFAIAVGMTDPVVLKDRLRDRHSMLAATFVRSAGSIDPLRDSVAVIEALASRP